MVETPKITCPEANQTSLVDKLAALGLEEDAGLRIVQRAKGAFRLRPIAAVGSPLPLGASRFGGEPDVPEGFEWPRHHGVELAFLCQINLSEVRHSSLPESGWLLFFYATRWEPTGNPATDDDAWRVMYVEGEPSRLSRHPANTLESERETFKPHALEITSSLNLPDGDDILVSHNQDLNRGYRLWEPYAKVVASLAEIPDKRFDNSAPPYHHLLGHPQLLQGDMRERCERFRNRTETNHGKLLVGARSWVLLLQLDTDVTGPGWRWGDAGRLYFWIRSRDLSSRSFDLSVCFDQSF